MKTQLILIILFLNSIAALAQFGDGISYQAVALDDKGKEIAGHDINGLIIHSKEIAIRFSIINEAIDGEILYQEIQNTYTDNNGLFSVVIGHGEITSSSQYNNLSEIDWSQNKKFLEIEIDIKSRGDFKLMGIQEMMSVPYAFYAHSANNFSGVYDKDSTNEIQDISLDGSNLQISRGSSIDLKVIDTDTKLSELEVDTYVSNNGYLTAEKDSLFNAWDKSSGISISESQITDLKTYLTTETDPFFTAWDKSSGVTVTESQVTDLKPYLTSETDPIFSTWDKDYADMINTPITISTLQADAIIANTTKNSYPTVDANKLAGIDAGAEVNVQSDWTEADNTLDAYIANKPNLAAVATSGDFTDLVNIPAGVADGDDNTQLTEAQVDAFADNNGYLTSETDPIFTIWDKSSGVTVTESQVTDLKPYLTSETDPTFTAWDKNSGVTVTESQVTDLKPYLTSETDPIFSTWDKDYADMINTPITISTLQSDAIIANTTKNSYPTVDANKLAGIDAGAEVNVQSDWTEADNTLDAYIANKPNLAAVATSGDFTDLVNIPAGVADGDDNTQLTEAQVDAFADNNGYLTSETDPIFTIWDKSSGVTVTESQVTDLKSYLTSETDPFFTAWDKSSGVTVTESQVTDLKPYLTSETDPIFSTWDKDYADMINTPITISTLQADAIIANTTKNSYPTVDANKLAGIDAGAEINVQGDWTEADNTLDAYISNKPNLAAVATSGDFTDIQNTPTTLSGYGITDAMSTSDPANTISAIEISNWNEAFLWGDHSSAGYETVIADGLVTQYWRGDKTWQTLDKEAVGLGNVDNVPISTWAGSSNLTTLGTISSGVWNAGEINTSSTITASSIIKTGGTSSQFLKADGSVDENNYISAIRDVADEFNAYAGQTVFTLTQTPSITCKVQMFINGIRISNNAYNVANNVLTYIPTNNGLYIPVNGDRIQVDYFY